MRRLLEPCHYGTACPATDHMPRNKRNSLALYLHGAKIAMTRFPKLKTARTFLRAGRTR